MPIRDSFGTRLARRLDVDGVPLVMTVTLKEPAGGLKAGENRLEFGVQTDRYRDQLAEFAAAVRDPAANPSSYDRDLRVHELTLAMCGLLQGI